MLNIDRLKNHISIEGKTVILETFTKVNITSSYLDWLNDSLVVRYSNQRFLKHSHCSALEYLESFSCNKNLFLAIYLKESYQYVGTVSIYFSEEHQTADIGIMIGEKSCWGNGKGGDAWNTVVNWLINEVMIRKVTGGTLKCNVGMMKIMINAGMKQDGIRSKHEIIEGREEDLIYFAKFKYSKYHDED